MFRITTDSLFPRTRESGVSHPVATILLVAITILLALLVLLMFAFPSFDFPTTADPPSFIEIRSVIHTSENGILNYDSRVVLFHNGTQAYPNNDLYATFYRNSKKLPCVIETFNGYEFIRTHHNGIQTMGGLGCQGEKWNIHEKIVLDFTDGTFHPGDLITVEVYQKPKNILISRYSRTA